MNKLVSLLIASMILTTSCQLAIDADVPKKPASLVVNSSFGPDTTWSVSVFKSKHILENQDIEPVENARILISDDAGEEFELTSIYSEDPIHPMGGLYGSNRKPNALRKYRINVKADDYAPAFATAAIPVVVSIQKVEISDSLNLKFYRRVMQEGGWSDNGKDKVPIEITFIDDASTRNYYRLFIHQRSYGPDLTKSWEQKLFYYEEKSKKMEDYSWVFDDTLITGKETIIEIELPVFAFPAFPPYEFDGIKFELQHLSEENFKYLTTQELQLKWKDDPFAQPVQVYNNIEGGFGIFAGFNSSIRILK